MPAVETEYRSEPFSLWVNNSLKRIPNGKASIAETVKGAPGLQLISRPSGGRSWKYFYQNPTTKRTDSVTLGPVKLTRELGENPVVGEPMTLGMAKELAAYCRRLVREKRDPKPILTKLKRDIEAVIVATWDGHKVDELFREYVANYNWRLTRGRPALPSTIEYYAARLGLRPDDRGGWKPTGNGVLSHWTGKIYAAHDGTVKIDHVEADRVLRQMAPAVADKTIEALRRFGDWAVYYKKANSNPFAILTQLHEHPERERELSAEEIRALWHVASTANGTLNYPYGAAAKLMLLTLQRPGAVRRARWADFDLTAGVWNVPHTERNKRRLRKKEANPVPLSAPALTLLNSLPHRGDYVFTEDGSNPISEDAKAAMRELHQHMSVELGAPVTRWQWRDLRRTGATGLSRLKVDTQFGPMGLYDRVIHAVLDHARDNIDATYIRNDYLTEARTALNAWAAHLETITSRRAEK
ncbi:site-specific integrase [Mesorhizobium sp. DCY119]|uniref:site-specific integrase n=1 Tax=Mesorhizobium sp. DCY119 TaxID=2108445 RepID=UPI000E6D42CB|nr:site-specific integrase [Mesorhizobium sp. DCY119]RJG45861.1 site-specific integrase [Mesorhizobium sp. DCY119]